MSGAEWVAVLGAAGVFVAGMATALIQVISAIHALKTATVQATQANTDAVEAGNKKLDAVRHETKALRIAATGAIPVQAPPNPEAGE